MAAIRCRPKRGTCLKELLSGLNVEVNMPVKQWEMVFSRIHIGFIWTEKICPPFRHLRKVREEIGLRTMINTVEKVMNPIQSKSIIIGVNHRTAMSHLVEILPRAGFETSYIVQGIEGAEELPSIKKARFAK